MNLLKEETRASKRASKRHEGSSEQALLEGKVALQLVGEESENCEGGKTRHSLQPQPFRQTSISGVEVDREGKGAGFCASAGNIKTTDQIGLRAWRHVARMRFSIPNSTQSPQTLAGGRATGLLLGRDAEESSNLRQAPFNIGAWRKNI